MPLGREELRLGALLPRLFEWPVPAERLPPEERGGLTEGRLLVAPRGDAEPDGGRAPPLLGATRGDGREGVAGRVEGTLGRGADGATLGAWGVALGR